MHVHRGQPGPPAVALWLADRQLGRCADGASGERRRTRAVRSRVGRGTSEVVQSWPARRHTSACRAQLHLLPAGGLFHLLPAGGLFHLLPAGALLHLLPAGGLLHLLPAGVVPPTTTTASLSRLACQTGRYAQPSPPTGRTPAKWHLLLGQKKPATYPRRPSRGRTAWTIPTVPCPSCQTASRCYAHSHRCPTIKHLLCQAGSTHLRLLADRLGWRPPPANPPDKPAALRYCPGETTEMANRHPSAHSATSPSPCLLSCLPTRQRLTAHVCPCVPPHLCEPWRTDWQDRVEPGWGSAASGSVRKGL
jgi:hypothetical protein